MCIHNLQKSSGTPQTTSWVVNNYNLIETYPKIMFSEAKLVVYVIENLKLHVKLIVPAWQQYH